MKVLKVLLLMAAACFAFGQAENPQLRKSMETFFFDWDRNMEEGNHEALMDVVHPSFVIVDKDGKKMTLAQLRPMFHKAMRNGRGMDSNTTVMHVREASGEAIAWVSVKCPMYGKGVTKYFAHTMKRGPSGWQIYYTQELPTDNGWRPGIG